MVSQDTRLQFKRSDTAYWESSNPILESGEPGYDTDLKLFKVGDGTSKWSELSYENNQSRNYCYNSYFTFWQRSSAASYNNFGTPSYIFDRWYSNDPSASITNMVGDGTNVTVTTSTPHGLGVGISVSITGVVPTVFNYTDAPVASVIDEYNFTLAKTDTNTFSSGSSQGLTSANSASTIARKTRDSGANGFYYMNISSATDLNAFQIFQPYDVNDVSILIGKTVTFSFYAFCATGSENITYSIDKGTTSSISTAVWTTIASKTSVISSQDANDLKRFSVTATIPNDGTVSGLRIAFYGSLITQSSTGAGVGIFDVQFEEGPAPTKYRPRSNTPQAELASCQRFYQRISGTVNQTFATGIYYNTTTCYVVYPLQVTTRVAPTVTASAQTIFAVSANAAGNNTTGITAVAAQQSINAIELALNTAAVTAGIGALVRFNTTGYIEISADL